MNAADAGRSADPLVFLVAAEPSGDLLGARLMAALRDETGGRVRFAGVGGERMAAEGLDSLFPVDDLAVMGLVEVVPKLALVYRSIRETVSAARRLRPDAVVTIDSPAFTLEVAGRLKGSGAALIHYVAPSVWAWKPWRARLMARYLDRVMTLLPFEPPLFARHGLTASFVGHPAVEQAALEGDGQAFRRRLGIGTHEPLLLVLPGSRRGEVRPLLPLFRDAAVCLEQRLPGLRAVVPTVGRVADDVAEAVAGWPLRTTVVVDAADKRAAFAAGQVALAASGTVTLELALAGVPTVVSYRLNNVSAVAFGLVSRTPYISLPNILLGRECQPELLQWRATPQRLAAALERLATSEQARARRLADSRDLAARLGDGDVPPSRRAARCVLAEIAVRRRS